MTMVSICKSTLVNMSYKKNDRNHESISVTINSGHFLYDEFFAIKQLSLKQNQTNRSIRRALKKDACRIIKKEFEKATVNLTK